MALDIVMVVMHVVDILMNNVSLKNSSATGNYSTIVSCASASAVTITITTIAAAVAAIATTVAAIISIPSSKAAAGSAAWSAASSETSILGICSCFTFALSASLTVCISIHLRQGLQFISFLALGRLVVLIISLR
jgi:hypothetical protein